MQELGHKVMPAYGLIPPNLPGALAEGLDPVPAADVNAPASIVLHYNENNGLHRQTAEYIQRKMRAHHVSITIQPLSHEQFYEHLLGQKSTAILAGKGLDYPDGMANLTYFRTDVKNHFLFMENDSLNRDLANLAFLKSEDRPQAYHEMQKRILAQRTILPLFFGHTTSGLWSARIRSVPSHPFGFQFLKMDEVQR